MLCTYIFGCKAIARNTNLTQATAPFRLSTIVLEAIVIFYEVENSTPPWRGSNLWSPDYKPSVLTVELRECDAFQFMVWDTGSGGESPCLQMPYTYRLADSHLRIPYFVTELGIRWGPFYDINRQAVKGPANYGFVYSHCCIAYHALCINNWFLVGNSMDDHLWLEMKYPLLNKYIFISIFGNEI